MSKIFVKSLLFAVALVVGATATMAANGDTLKAVLAKGKLQCGTSQGLAGFSNPDDKGVWTGIDVDVCRAVAAAVLGDAEKVDYIPLSAKARFAALSSGEVDVLPRNTTWTLSRDTSLAIDFVGVNYYDGQGFMVRKSMGVNSVKDLSGATICVNTGTTTELNLADYFRTHNLRYKIVAFEKSAEVAAAYDVGRCDAYTTDRSGLAAQRQAMKKPNDHKVLPEVISKEPLGPAVRHGDNQWGDVVRWVLNAMVVAEELGVNSKNVDQQRKTTSNPEVKRLLGTDGKMGEMLGLKSDWAYNVIKQVGNYEESYERNVGPKTPLQLDRGVNRLWTKGGILYAPPIR